MDKKQYHYVMINKKILWINEQLDKLLPEQKKILNNKFIPYLTKNKN